MRSIEPGIEAMCTVQKEKARDRFPGVGFCISCDVEDMQVICPTCQILRGHHISLAQRGGF
jgi:hypothetical protein